MNSRPPFDDLLSEWLEEGPASAPAPILGTVSAAIPSIPQRRALIRLPFRTPMVSTYLSMAAAAAVVVAVGSIALAVLLSGTDQVGGPKATPSPSPSTSRSPSPSVSPALTETFTSSMYGISVGYPAGWLAQRATQPWTGGVPQEGTPLGDFICLFAEQPIPSAADCWSSANIFVALASQPLGGMSGEDWIADFLTDDAKCGTVTEPITIDGTSGVISRDCLDSQAALVAAGDRGYLIWFYVSGDNPALAEPFDKAWFDQFLATVKLHPDNAIDEAPSASP